LVELRQGEGRHLIARLSTNRFGFILGNKG
jgi:hypothetical protein